MTSSVLEKKRLNIIIVAHPDDESLFFAGLILSRSHETNWVVCVTDANADGQSVIRKQCFHEACEILGVNRAFWLNFEDNYSKRLDSKTLQEKLESDVFTTISGSLGDNIEVFTHGPVGEYMHPHHQDVSYSVYSLVDSLANTLPNLKIKKVFSPAYNCYHELQIDLTEKQFEIKSKVNGIIYRDETRRFFHLLPTSSVETFRQFQFDHVSEIYHYFLSLDGKIELDSKNPYKWLESHIYFNQKNQKQRLF